MEQYRAKRQELQGLQERLNELETTVTSEDEMVTVTVGPQGQLTRLEFNPRVYRTLAPHELSETITETTRKAFEELTDKRREAMGSLASGAAGFDISRFLPDRPDDFESVKEHYGFRDR
jgi:DNA-binding protein YbaB